MLMQEDLVPFVPQYICGPSADYLLFIPAVPIVAAGFIALLKQSGRKTAATLAIGSLSFSLLLSLVAFAHVLSGWMRGITTREVFNFTWIHSGATNVDLGWVLDPLSAIMLVMVSFVGLLIFIYSIGYMKHDENFTRFFCFMSLFAGAMLGVVIANSLLLLFMCWEIVGLTSYLLIGYWYQKPSAAAAAKKAFLTTRIGDVFFLLGIVWLFAQTGTLLFYNHDAGSIESASLSVLLSQPAAMGLTAAGAIGLLIFAGAAGKSGQFPLHVWLPDAMEGPTPVSALIHAATMVAAGVYLIARVYPLMAAGALAGGTTTALTVVTWVGASTAVFAALIAVAQNDIKRILAYSTVSQLGYMMAGLGMGGVAVGVFHLITHAFFKALLFLGAGSVIHGCHEEHNIRRMGGLKADMPMTFVTYAIGMLALCGFPLLFSGFWSKDGILDAAYQLWSRGGERALTMRAVARTARTTTPTVYQRFRDKKDILELLRKRAQEIMFSYMRRAHTADEFCSRYFEFALKHSNEYELIHADWAVRLAKEEARPSFDLLKKSLADRLGGTPEEHAGLALALAALLHGTATLLLAKGVSERIARELRHACVAAFETLVACASGRTFRPNHQRAARS